MQNVVNDVNLRPTALGSTQTDIVVLLCLVADSERSLLQLAKLFICDLRSLGIATDATSKLYDITTFLIHAVDNANCCFSTLTLHCCNSCRNDYSPQFSTEKFAKFHCKPLKIVQIPQLITASDHCADWCSVTEGWHCAELQLSIYILAKYK